MLLLKLEQALSLRVVGIEVGLARAGYGELVGVEGMSFERVDAFGIAAESFDEGEDGGRERDMGGGAGGGYSFDTWKRLHE